MGTAVRIRSADAPGGNIVADDPSLALAEAITDAADIWDCGNVNVNTLAGRVAAQPQHAVAELAVTGPMIAAGSIRIDLPFTPARMVVDARTATGAARGAGADTSAISGAGILVSFGGGAASGRSAGSVQTIVLPTAKPGIRDCAQTHSPVARRR